MRYRETALSFECEGARLLGILTAPETPGRVGCVVVVGGPQYRVGSHRQFVALARALATSGISCLRFDYRGMGDSEDAPRNFESIDADLAAALDAFERATGTSRIVLWGLCDGASAALMYAFKDARVVGVVAVNPWARTETSAATARLRHYYLRRLMSRDLWQKVLARRFDLAKSAHDLADDARRSIGASGSQGANYLQRMHHGWKSFRRPILFVLSGNDLTAREFETWMAADPVRRRLCRRADCQVLALEAADHTFSGAQWREQLERRTIEWIHRVH